MRILAFGATGFVGGHLVPHLLERGHEVTVAARSGRAATPSGARIIQADPVAPGPWQDEIPEHDVIINLAGTPVTTRWDEAGKRAILDSRVLSTRNIVDALGAATDKVFLCANAVGFYGDAGDRLCTEESPRGTGFLADVAQAWQAEALRAENFGHRVAIPRISVVMGRGGALAKMRPVFAWGLGGKLGSGRQWFPWIHVQDLVRAMAFLVETPAASGIFNACAPHPVTNAEFTRALGRMLRRPTILSVPGPILKLVLGEAASMLLGGQRCLPGRLCEVGFAFNHPTLDSALASLR